MKRFVVSLLVIVFALAGAVGLSADDSHLHIYADYNIPVGNSAVTPNVAFGVGTTIWGIFELNAHAYTEILFGADNIFDIAGFRPIGLFSWGAGMRIPMGDFSLIMDWQSFYTGIGYSESAVLRFLQVWDSDRSLRRFRPRILFPHAVQFLRSGDRKRPHRYRIERGPDTDHRSGSGSSPLLTHSERSSRPRIEMCAASWDTRGMASPEIRNPFFNAPVVSGKAREPPWRIPRAVSPGVSPNRAAAGFSDEGAEEPRENWCRARREPPFTPLDPSLFPFSAALFPLLTGLGIARYCESLGLSPRIKWPNDILVDDAKLAGILCESTGGRLFAGIGLNCLQREFPEGLRTRGTSLFLCAADGRKPLEHLTPVLAALRMAYGSINWKGAITARLYRAGETIHFREGSAAAPGEIIGVLEGIGAGGELLVRENATGRLRSCFSGEIAPGM
jgi:biotin-(acetyl-CoA carboxylase) ligase